jgi:hypothetical protein
VRETSKDATDCDACRGNECRSEVTWTEKKLRKFIKLFAAMAKKGMKWVQEITDYCAIMTVSHECDSIGSLDQSLGYNGLARTNTGFIVCRTCL